MLLDVGAGRRADSSLERRARALPGPDRALCQEIAFGALRWKLLLDQRLDALLAKGLDSLPAAARAVLEVAAYQLLFLDRVPPHAVLDSAVDDLRGLLPPAQARGLAGVVNATLRNLSARRAELEPIEGPVVERLAVATSHPAWLVGRWLERFGEERATAILEADNRRPGTHLRPHAARIGALELVERLRAEGGVAELHPLHAGCVVLRGGDPARFEAFRAGLFAVQDVSAQIVAGLAADFVGGLFVDLCAAPGGKAGAVAERRSGRAATFLAVDVSRPRLARLVENARRQALPLAAVVADGRDLALRRPADFVLADVPCLGTGTFRRRVDARWQKSPERLPALVELQRGIVRNAAALLAPGGRLLYSTCSLEREENEETVEWLLASHSELRPVDLSHRLPRAMTVSLPGRPERALFLTPEAGDCDGAFATVLERAG